MLCKDLDPENLTYDNYWDNEVKGKIKDFVLLSKLAERNAEKIFMANKEHLSLIHNRSEWNEWRGQNPNTKPDLSAAIRTTFSHITL